MDYFEFKATKKLALNVSAKIRNFKEDSTNFMDILYDLVDDSFSKKILTSDDFFIVTMYKNGEYILHLPSNLKGYEKRNMYIHILFVMYKYFNFPIKNTPIEKDIKYISSQENNTWKYFDNKFANIFACYFLYNEKEFMDILKETYCREDNTYAFDKLQTLTKLDEYTLKFRANEMNLIEFSP